MTNEDEKILEEVHANTTKVVVVDKEQEACATEFERVIESLDPNKPTIYLGGGFYGDWNQKVKDAIGDSANIIDPRELDSGIPEYLYVERDLTLIEASDIVFIYRQRENPGYGVVYEAGFAYRAGKTLVTCLEYENSRVQRYLAFPRVCTDYFHLDLEHAINDLVSLVALYYESTVEDLTDDTSPEVCSTGSDQGDSVRTEVSSSDEGEEGTSDGNNGYSSEFGA